MARGKELRIAYKGRRMNLCQFAKAAGLSRRTVQDRWSRGERDIEQLSRPARPKLKNSERETEHSWLNSLLAGWKCPEILGASAETTGPSAKCS